LLLVFSFVNLIIETFLHDSVAKKTGWNFNGWGEKLMTSY